MSEYGFSLTRLFPNKNKIYDSILIRENTDQIKPVLSHILVKESKALDSTLGERRAHAKI